MEEQTFLGLILSLVISLFLVIVAEEFFKRFVYSKVLENQHLLNVLAACSGLGGLLIPICIALVYFDWWLVGAVLTYICLILIGFVILLLHQSHPPTSRIEAIFKEKAKKEENEK